jgi:nucleoid DNA-binding protein
MLTKSELIDVIVDSGAGDRRHVRNMLDALADIGLEEIADGEDFVIPGLAKIFYTYRKPQRKGERWKKGETVTGFGGIESVKDTDSPPVKAGIRLKAIPTGPMARLKPKTKVEDQAAFLKTSAGKAVAKRKG